MVSTCTDCPLPAEGRDPVTRAPLCAACWEKKKNATLTFVLDVAEWPESEKRRLARSEAATKAAETMRKRRAAHKEGSVPAPRDDGAQSEELSRRVFPQRRPEGL